MAKITLTDVSNITGAESAAISAINANWDAIIAAFETTLSRDGTSPNTMSADLDMNSNDILNAGSVTTTSLTVNGEGVQIVDLATALKISNNLSDVANASTALTNLGFSTDGKLLIDVVKGTAYQVLRMNAAATDVEFGNIDGSAIADGSIDDDHIATPSILRTRILNELWFNEPTFGAPADTAGGEATDASTAFQDFVDAANGRPMFLPPREYGIRIESEIELNRQTTTTGHDNEVPILIGSGIYTSKIIGAVDNGAVFKHTQLQDYAYGDGALFQDFWIEGDAGATACNGFELNGLYGPTLRRIKITDMTGDGINEPYYSSTPDAGANGHALLEHVYIYDCDGWGINAQSAATTWNILQPQISTCAHGGINIESSGQHLIEGGFVAYCGNATYKAAANCAGIKLGRSTSYPTSMQMPIVRGVEIDRNYYSQVWMDYTISALLEYCKIIDDSQTGTDWRSSYQVYVTNAGSGENVIRRNTLRLNRESGTGTTVGIYLPSGSNNTYIERNLFSIGGAAAGGVTELSDGGTNNLKVDFGATY